MREKDLEESFLSLDTADLSILLIHVADIAECLLAVKRLVALIQSDIKGSIPIKMLHIFFYIERNEPGFRHILPKISIVHDRILVDADVEQILHR